MLDSYIFIDKERLEEVEGCGMKLSTWADRNFIRNGEETKFISTYLNPRDNMEKYKSQDYRIVKLEVDMRYCYIAEGFLLGNSSDKKVLASSLYIASIMPAKEYVFGMYRRPECLISKTILPDEMKIQGKGCLSFPLFYESSQSLYLNKLMEGLREENKNFDDLVLYFYFESLAQRGEAERQNADNRDIAVYSFKDGRRPVVLELSEQEVLIEG